jgi:GNAT superfamily N-acetyltransferase
VPATIRHWEQLRELFATSKGVDDCWCMWPRREPMTAQRDRARNSSDMQALLEAGDSPGLLAVIDKRAVGWCATGPRTQYPQYPQRAESGLVWAIPCIYVEPTADRTVVARSLIETAVAIARSRSAVAVDGPPPWWLPGDAAAIAVAVRTFVANGFVQIAAGARMPELRRALAASSASTIT